MSTEFKLLSEMIQVEIELRSLLCHIASSLPEGGKSRRLMYRQATSCTQRIHRSEKRIREAERSLSYDKLALRNWSDRVTPDDMLVELGIVEFDSVGAMSRPGAARGEEVLTARGGLTSSHLPPYTHFHNAQLIPPSPVRDLPHSGCQVGVHACCRSCSQVAEPARERSTR